MPKQISWYYHRKSWTSCKRSDEFIGKNGIDVSETVDARKSRFGPEDLDFLLGGVESLVGARGKRVIELDPSDAETRAELEKLVIGPSGNLRAPAARAGNKFLVGFNDEMWSDCFG